MTVLYLHISFTEKFHYNRRQLKDILPMTMLRKHLLKKKLIISYLIYSPSVDLYRYGISHILHKYARHLS